MRRSIAGLRSAGTAGTLALLFGAGCADAPRITGPVLVGDAQPVCRDHGAVHVSDVAAPAVWLAAEGPHVVVGPLNVTSALRIEAGAVVCGSPGARLILGAGGALDVAGTAAAPVRLTARDPTRPWGGISTLAAEQWASLEPRATISLSHVLVEHADVGVAAHFDADVVIDSTRFRQISASAVSAGPGVHARMTGSVIDTAGTATEAAAASWSHRYGAAASLRIAHSVIRGARGVGVYAGPMSGTTLSDVRIEGSGGVGLDHATGVVPWYRGSIQVEGPIRITGSGSYPARLPFNAAARLMRLQHPDSLLGNAADTLIVGRDEEGSTGTEPAIIPAELPWVLGTYSVNQQIRLQAGATLIVTGAVHGSVLLKGGLVAEGRADAPAVIMSDAGVRYLYVFGPDASRLEHVEVTDLRLISDGEHELVMEEIAGSDAVFELHGPATLRRIVLERGGVRVLGGHAAISRCTITDAPGDAIAVALHGTASVTHCNLVGNAGAGVGNSTGVPVDARANWWGDPAGPEGSAGDGVSGLVDFVPWLTAPTGG